jgi:virulence-associated protein VagC
MTRAHSRTFRSGNSEAVRLPRDVAFGEDVDAYRDIVATAGDITQNPSDFRDVPGLEVVTW